MCGKACQDNEECRYEKENCEYKCQIKKIMIWAPIVAAAGTIIIGLLAFFVVRHSKKKAKIENNNVEKQPDYEVPYQYTMNRNDTQNESVNIENEQTYEAYQSAEYEAYDEMYAEPYANNKNKR